MKTYRNRALELFFDENKSAVETAKIIIEEFNISQPFNSVQKNIYNSTKHTCLYEA